MSKFPMKPQGSIKKRLDSELIFWPEPKNGPFVITKDLKETYDKMREQLINKVKTDE